MQQLSRLVTVGSLRLRSGLPCTGTIGRRTVDVSDQQCLNGLPLTYCYDHTGSASFQGLPFLLQVRSDACSRSQASIVSTFASPYHTLSAVVPATV